MEFVYLIIGLQILGSIAALAGIVYLIIRRNRIKKQENYERRSN